MMADILVNFGNFLVEKKEEADPTSWRAIARILEQANGIPVNDIIQRNQLELAMKDEWDMDKKGFTDVPYRDPSVVRD